MLGDARVTTDDQRGRVDNADAGTVPQLRVQIDRQRRQHARHQIDEPSTADQLREHRAQLGLDAVGGEALEGAVARLLKGGSDSS